MNSENIYKPPDSDLIQDNEDEFNFAGFWIRVGATLIDTILIMFITAPLVTLVYGTGYWSSEAFVNGVWDLLISYVLPALIVILFWLYKSATPGKMIFNLEVISLGENRKLSIGQSIGRYLGYFPSMLVLMLGVIWVAFDKKKQGWHDKWANTAVIKKRKNA